MERIDGASSIKEQNPERIKKAVTAFARLLAKGSLARLPNLHLLKTRIPVVRDDLLAAHQADRDSCPMSTRRHLMIRDVEADLVVDELSSKSLAWAP